MFSLVITYPNYIVIIGYEIGENIIVVALLPLIFLCRLFQLKIKPIDTKNIIICL